MFDKINVASDNQSFSTAVSKRAVGQKFASSNLETEITRGKMIKSHYEKYLRRQMNALEVRSLVHLKEYDIADCIPDVTLLKSGPRFEMPKKMASAIVDSLLGDKGVVIDLALRFSNAKPLCGDESMRFYHTNHPPILRTVPIKYLHLYTDEFLSTRINWALSYAPIHVALSLTQTIDAVRVDQICDNIITNGKPFVTIRNDAYKGITPDYTYKQKDIGNCVLQCYGVFTPIFKPKPPAWSKTRGNTKKLDVVIRAMLGRIPDEELPRKLRTMMSKYGKSQVKWNFKLGNLYNLHPASFLYQRLWDFLATAHEWTIVGGAMLDDPDKYWHPSLFYKYFETEDTPTVYTTVEEDLAALRIPQPTGLFSNTSKAISNLAKADVMVDQLSEKLERVARVGERALEMVAPVVTNRASNLLSELTIGPLTSAVNSMFGANVVAATGIDIAQIALNIYAMRRCNNKAAKLAYGAKMLSDSGALESVVRGVAYVLHLEGGTDMPTDDSSLLDVFFGWCSSLATSPLHLLKKMYQFFIGLFSNFSAVGSGLVQQGWLGLLRTCKNLHTLAQGALGISRLGDFFWKVVEHAKLFCNRHLGCKFDVVDYVALANEISRMCNYVAHLIDTRVCAAVLSNENVRRKMIHVFTMLSQLRVDPRVIAKRPLVSAINDTFTSTKEARLKLAIAEQMSAASMTPFALLLVGDSGAGKSHLVEYLCDKLAGDLGLNKLRYHMNASSDWMDGYLGSESFIIIDDIFSTTNVEEVKFLLNAIGPGLFLAPVAMNELRPTAVSAPIFLLTSNTPYVNASELTAPDAVDRRLPKFEVIVNPDVYDRHNKVLNVRKFNEIGIRGCYTFRSIAPVRHGRTDNEIFTFDNWYSLVLEMARTHIVDQSNVYKKAAGASRVEGIIKQCLVGELSDEDIERAIRLPFDIETTFAAVRRSLEGEVDVNPEPEAGTSQQPTVNYLYDEMLRTEDETLTGFATLDVDNAPNNVLWDDASAVHYRRSFRTYALPDGRAFDVDTIFADDLSWNGDRWVLRDYVPIDPNGVPIRGMSAYLVDGPLIAFHNSWFALTPEARWHVYQQMIRSQQYREWSRRFRGFMSNAWDQIRDPITTVGRILSFMMGITVLYTIFVVIIFATSMYLENMFAPEVPTSMYKAKDTVGGVLKAKDFQRPTFSTNQHIQNSKGKVMSNVFNARMKTGKGMGNFLMLGLRQHFYAIPKHVIYNVPTVDGHYQIDIMCRGVSAMRNAKWSTFYINKLDVVHVPDRDISIVRIWDRSMVPDVTKMIPDAILSENDIAHVANIYLMDNTFGEINTLIVGKKDRVNLRTNNATVVVKDSYMVGDTHSVGMSGGPSFAMDTGSDKRLLGMLSSTSFDGSYSCVTPLIRGEIEEAIASLSPDVPEPSVDVVTCEFAEMPIVGTTKEKVSVPFGTSLKKTPIYGVLGDCKSIPVLAVKCNDPLETGRFKTQRTELCGLDPVLLNKVTTQLGYYYRQLLYKNYGRLPKARGIHDAILGNYVGGKHIELTTSPGIGKGKWMFGREKPGKTDFIRVDSCGELEFLDGRVVDVVNGQIADHLAGKTSPTAFAQFPKDELRPAGKAARSIDGSPLEDQVEYRMLFGEFDGMLNNCPKLDTRSAPGIDLQGGEGAELAEFLSNPTYSKFMYDVKSWDANITHQLYMADAAVTNIVYDDEFCTARKMLLRQTCLAPIVSGDYVICPGKGMRSGYPGTANSNTRIHLILFLYCVWKIVQNTKRDPSLVDVFQIVFVLCYADDIIGCVVDPLWADIVNGETIALEMEAIGFEVVDPNGKNVGVRKFVPFEEINFLKHTPTWCDDLGRYIWRIDVESIKNCINYSSGVDFTESLDSIFYHSFPHGRKFYENIRHEVNRRCLSLGVQYPITYDMMVEKWMKKIQQVCVPVIVLDDDDYTFDD